MLSPEKAITGCSSIPARSDAMRPIYFDTNIYDDIAKTGKGVQALRAELARRKLVAILSIVNVEELIGDWDTNRPKTIRRLDVTRELVDFDNILKEPNVLLKEAIEGYATDGPRPPRTLPQDQLFVLSSCLHKVANGNAQLDPVLSRIVAEVRREKEIFKAMMKRARAQSRDEFTQRYEPRVLAQIPFEEFWSDAPLWAEAFADHFGFGDLCRERGLEGLLEVRTVRSCVGAVKSLVYSQVANGRQPDLGDWHDVWHAILASVADVFVTRDKRLAEVLGRVPSNDCRVITSLDELLADRGA